jgi:hypothetical protein
MWTVRLVPLKFVKHQTAVTFGITQCVLCISHSYVRHRTYREYWHEEGETSSRPKLWDQYCVHYEPLHSLWPLKEPCSQWYCRNLSHWGSANIYQYQPRRAEDLQWQNCALPKWVIRKENFSVINISCVHPYRKRPQCIVSVWMHSGHFAPSFYRFLFKATKPLDSSFSEELGLSHIRCGSLFCEVRDRPNWQWALFIVWGQSYNIILHRNYIW